MCIPNASDRAKKATKTSENEHFVPAGPPTFLPCTPGSAPHNNDNESDTCISPCFSAKYLIYACVSVCV